MKKPVATLRAQIRAAVDAADRRLAQPEIFDKVERGVGRNVFCVTIAQMLDDKQLSRRKATKAVRAVCPGVRFVYGPGPVPVEDREGAAGRRRKSIGFMAMAREREARAAARRSRSA